MFVVTLVKSVRMEQSVFVVTLVKSVRMERSACLF